MSGLAASASADPIATSGGKTEKTDSSEWKILKTLNNSIFESATLYAKVISDLPGPDAADRLARSCDAFAKEGGSIKDIKVGLEKVEKALADQTRVLEARNGAAESVRRVHEDLQSIMQRITQPKEQK